ncbi:hypothetical protein ACFSHR_05435 [Azotobacter chroococcum]
MAQAFVPVVQAIKAEGRARHPDRPRRPQGQRQPPWEGDDHIAEGDPRGWQTIAPRPSPSATTCRTCPRP